MADAQRFFRAERRDKMKLAGQFLNQTKPTASKRMTTGKLSESTRSVLSNIAKLTGLREELTFTPYAIKRRSTKVADLPSRYLVAIGKPERETAQKVNYGIAIVAKELNGQIIGYRVYHQR
jgi:hypothetical protein